MTRKPVMALLASMLLLAACQSGSNGNGSVTSTLTTPAGGHGSGDAAAMLASRLGQALDANDRVQATAAAQRAQTAPVGQQVSWTNSQNSHSGTVMAVRDGYDQAGHYCREFQQTATLGATAQPPVYGKACQQPDGSWKMVQ